MNRRSFPAKIIIGGVVLCSVFVILFVRWKTVFSPKLENVSLGSSRSMNDSFMIIAQEQGWFEREGIALIFKEYPTASLALEAVCDQQLDMASVAETPVVFTSFARDDIRILASLYSAYNDPKVIARKTSGIESPADLRGKRIGTTQQGQSAHYFLHLFLAKHGLPEQDVTLSFASPEQLKRGFASGEFDALSLFEPHVSELAHAHPSEAVIFSEPGLYLKRFLLVTSANFTKQRPQTVQKMLRAFLQAKEFAHRQPERAMQIVATRLGVSVSDVQKCWGEVMLEVSLEQSLLLTLESEAAWAIAHQLTDRQTLPNYLAIIYFDGLNSVAPEYVTIYSFSEQ